MCCSRHILGKNTGAPLPGGTPAAPVLDMVFGFLTAPSSAGIVNVPPSMSAMMEVRQAQPKEVAVRLPRWTPGPSPIGRMRNHNKDPVFSSPTPAKYLIESQNSARPLVDTASHTPSTWPFQCSGWAGVVRLGDVGDPWEARMLTIHQPSAPATTTTQSASTIVSAILRAPRPRGATTASSA